MGLTRRRAPLWMGLLFLACARRVPSQAWPVGSAPAEPLTPVTAPVTVAQSWGPATQLVTEGVWIYAARCTVSRERCEVARAPLDGGTADAFETLFTGHTLQAFAVDGQSLYVLLPTKLVGIALDAGAPNSYPLRVLADTGGVPLQLSAARGRVVWSEANPSRLLSVSGEGNDDEEASFDEWVDVPMFFAALPRAVLVANGDSETGNVELARLPSDAHGDGVRMRVEPRAGVPSSMLVVGPTLYFCSMDRAGSSHLWRTPLAFTARTRPEELHAEGLGLGVHDLGMRGDDLYFLDATGPARVSKDGGVVERLGTGGSALTASPSGVFVGLLDGGIARLVGPERAR